MTNSTKQPKISVFASARVTVSLSLSQPWSASETVANFRERARRALEQEIELMFQELNGGRTSGGHIKLVKIGEIGMRFEGDDS